MSDTLEEIAWYAEKAAVIKTEHKSLAEVYVKIAEEHVEIYKMLHDKVVDLIEEEKRKGVSPPNFMLEVWNFEHERLIEEFAKVKFLISEFHNSR
jgi:hypothetical protein